MVLSVLIVGGFGWSTGRAHQLFVPWQQGATTNPEAFSIYLLPSPPGAARLRTDLVRIGLAIPSVLLVAGIMLTPAISISLVLPSPRQPSEGQNLFALVIKVKLGTIARCLQPALVWSSSRVEYGPSLNPAAEPALRIVSLVITAWHPQKTYARHGRKASGHCTPFMQKAECSQAPDNPGGAEVPAVPSIFNDESPAHSTTCLPPDR